jgi:hypothetical protein
MTREATTIIVLLATHRSNDRTGMTGFSLGALYVE